MSASRTVSVSVADDDDAYLGLTQRGSGRRSYTDGVPDTIGFDIPSPSDDDYGGTDPEGLGADSVYRFGHDAGNDERGLFAVRNQGTNPIRVYSTQPDREDVPSVVMYDIDSGDTLTESDPSAVLGVGDVLVCGLEIDTYGVPVREDEYDLTLTINGVATNE
ncbi:hypothetical protein [Halobaculum marinum]|uniref:DUF1102 domain-containing protein n=1 Tax=Halobaculum marinum TaxID=3031996 RepID=A0ABD5WUU6_9EURY